jgi:16S rRNA (uracil1498-N3)-methyltransferase
MRIHRFFIDNNSFKKGTFEYSNKEFLNQIRNVLRLKPGNRIFLFNGKMNEVEAEIIEIKKDFIKLKILKIEKNFKKPRTKVVLYCSILKHQNFDIVIQKATEIGINEIFPIISKRTVKLNIQDKRLKKIIKEASEQSGRVYLPVLHDILSVSEAIKNAAQNEINLICDKSGDEFKKKKSKFLNSIGIFIGPEGGWSEEELKLFKENNFKIINLGELTLRAETAAIIASYLAVNYF